MKIPIIILLSVLLISVIIFLLNKKKNQKVFVENNNGKQASTITGKMFADTLQSLGYFSLTDSEKIDSLKEDIKETFDRYRIITTIHSEEPPFEPYCRRYYNCDGETLFEDGGVVDYLKEIKPTFDKLGIPLTWSSECFSDDATEHTIILNGKKYTAFKGNPNDPLIWGWATKNFVEMLSDELRIHNSDERVYPIMGGNDGRIIFLTRPQYDFIFRHVGEKEKPKEVNLWWQENT